jgi:DNA modification methylase
MITTKDSLEFLKEQKDFSFDINYSDPPYALGSEIIIRPDGKYDYKKATDFMNKWEMPTGEYWESWFEESYRTLKHGGYCIMYGMDRQLPMFQYYAIKSGFQVRQSMYWYFISSFPKATDLSKMIDKNANAEREIVGTKVRGDVQKAKEKGVGFLGDYANRNNVKQFGYGVEDLTLPETNLAKKYDGYKYSIAPLKQTCETIMIFQKPYKTGSCMHDVLAYENGDDTCGCFALNIDAGRVATDDVIKPTSTPEFKDIRSITKEISGVDFISVGLVTNAKRIDYEQNLQGRFPSQTFCDSEVSKILDEQSGVFTSSKSNKVYDNNAENRNVKNSASGQRKPESTYGDTGGCSKILHKCDYENGEMDLYVYEPKVSKSERNAGCEQLEVKKFEGRDTGQDDRNVPYKKRPEMLSNTHPTLKPISLSYRILKLFKSPNDQKIIYPFAGVQSEVIGGYKAGFTDYVGCELSDEYVNIGNARFEHWKNKPFDKKGKLEKSKDVKKINEQLKFLI